MISLPPSDAEIDAAARTFRAAIDAAGPKPWPDGYPFPAGACDVASELLGRYLIDQFGIVADYVCQNGREYLGGWLASHAWLEWNGLTIDITGDQFGWDAVIVTRTPKFHGQGDNQARHRVCHESEVEWWRRECGPLWRAIEPHLPPNASPHG